MDWGVWCVRVSGSRFSSLRTSKEEWLKDLMFWATQKARSWKRYCSFWVFSTLSPSSLLSWLRVLSKKTLSILMIQLVKGVFGMLLSEKSLIGTSGKSAKQRMEILWCILTMFSIFMKDWIVGLVLLNA